MKALGLFALTAGSLLGSASPPAQELDYDFSGFRDWDMKCAAGQAEPCGILPARSARKFAAGDSTEIPPRLPIETLAVDEAVTGAKAAASAPPAPAPVEAVASPVRIVVSIPAQRIYVFENDALVATSPVSTGKRGHATPTGTFRILQKKVRHHSNLYDNAPMPYMQRLTHGGIALHAGKLPGYPASHGCIRMPWSFAKKLYGMTNFQTRVTITDRRPETPEAAIELI